MVSTVKETWTSITDLKYGQTIVKKTVGQAFWYWLKYLLTVTVVGVVLALAALAYFTPQIPALSERFVPDMEIQITDGKLSSNVPQPLILGDDNFKFILNTQGSDQDLDKINSGILVLSDRVLFKDQGQTQTFNLSEMGQDVKVDKKMVIDWLNANRGMILSIGLAVVAIGGLFILGGIIVGQWISFLAGALLLWLIAKITKHAVDFSASLKLAIYAAVPSFLISLLVGQSQSASFITLAVWGFFAIAWLIKLPYNKK